MVLFSFLFECQYFFLFLPFWKGSRRLRCYVGFRYSFLIDLVNMGIVNATVLLGSTVFTQRGHSIFC